jgi:TPR repeat protein
MKKIPLFALLAAFQTACVASPPATDAADLDRSRLAVPPQTDRAAAFMPDDFLRIERAAGAGDAEAQYLLALMYGEGAGVQKNLAITVFWLEKAARQGYAKAQSVLGASYLLGEGAPKNPPMAVAWLEKAALQGDLSAQSNLGAVYLNGDGVPQNLDRARWWLEKAALSGSAYAQRGLALMYLNGWGVSRDETIATRWLTKAVEQNDLMSKRDLEKIRQRDGAEQVTTDERGAVLDVVARWAQAWSRKDVHAYLAYYAADFRPPNGEKRSVWAAQRRARIENKQRIAVTVDAPRVDIAGDTAVVRFRQKYVSDNLIRLGSKKIVLAKRADRWKIVREIAAAPAEGKAR